MPGRQRGEGGVQSVERALDVLERLAVSDVPRGVSELAQETGLPHATIHRLLATLTGRGYVRQEPQSRKYLPGSRLVRLGTSGGRVVASWARPYLAELARLSGETANLATLEDGQVVYLAQVPSRYRVRMFTEVGNRVLAHTTAVGKVLLAARPTEEVLDILARHGMPARTANTITDAHEFCDALAEVNELGYAVDDEEEELGVRCLAVPVRGPGTVEAALSISGPAGRLNRGRCAQLAPEMASVADEMAVEVFGARPSSGSATGASSEVG